MRSLTLLLACSLTALASFSMSAENFYSSLNLLLSLLGDLRLKSVLPRSHRALGLQVVLLSHRHPLLLALALIVLFYLRCDMSLMLANASLTFLSFSFFTPLIEAFYEPCRLASSREDLQTFQVFCTPLLVHLRLMRNRQFLDQEERSF